MLKPGDKAPAFALLADSGETVRLSAFRGNTVVLYFYPADDTPGCTVEACELRDSWAGVKKAGAVVLGVSPDGVASHGKFRTKYRLPFALLADEDHAVAARYGAWGEKQMYGRKYMGIRRTTFVIDGKGRIRTVFENVKPKGHAAQILEAIQ
jgi:thioredoxin-dependent peroxiredoxin